MYQETKKIRTGRTGFSFWCAPRCMFTVFPRMSEVTCQPQRLADLPLTSLTTPLSVLSNGGT